MKSSGHWLFSFSDSDFFPCDYIRPIWIMQDNLPISISLTWSHLQSPFCHVRWGMRTCTSWGAKPPTSFLPCSSFPHFLPPIVCRESNSFWYTSQYALSIFFSDLYFSNRRCQSSLNMSTEYGEYPPNTSLLCSLDAIFLNSWMVASSLQMLPLGHRSHTAMPSVL